jgi:hypothetical protein
MIAWRIQEKFYGGHDKAILRVLDGLVRGKVAKPATEPRLRPGTVLKREHGAFFSGSGLVQLEALLSQFAGVISGFDLGDALELRSLSFLALVLEKALEDRIAALGRSGSWPEIIADLDSLAETEIEQDATDEGTSCLS